MELNYTWEDVKWVPNGGVSELSTKLAQDWLTLESECTKQAKLIEQLGQALIGAQYNTSEMIGSIYCKQCGVYFPKNHKKDCVIGIALSAVREWRKEQER